MFVDGQLRETGFRGSQLNAGDVLGVGEHLESRGPLLWAGRVSVTPGGGVVASRKLAGIVTYNEVRTGVVGVTVPQKYVPERRNYFSYLVGGTKSITQ